ncbi:hypothetical protein [Rhodopirellula bahusiensis]|uniref:Uncharacterized protein n=1 Tax=Rhodopirellula bahusiensis TaxID=2014065 RepID=A0A2G1W5K5_9BACT|nr:hypothetical protein [Rhodopirellula bahusiensis]PHQ34318.1 hypothetical protein CEE69_14945 [Rhodopirellula bahusiensis]
MANQPEPLHERTTNSDIATRFGLRLATVDSVASKLGIQPNGVIGSSFTYAHADAERIQSHIKQTIWLQSQADTFQFNPSNFQ